MSFPRVNVLGVGVSAINMKQALETIDKWIESQEKQYICVTGVHGVIECQQDISLLQIHNNAGLVTPDGMPLVWLSKLYGFQHVSRVYGPDLMLAVCEHSVSLKYRHFFYGGNEGVPELLAEKLERRFPGLNVVGTYSPPFRPLTDEEESTIVQKINEARADIVWIGLSTPKQERWMAAHVEKLSVPVLIGVGAAFDFHAGIKQQAPLWMQRSGIEWLFRLLAEPKRLWRRYLINNPKFVTLILLQAFKIHRYSMPENLSENVL